MYQYVRLSEETYPLLKILYLKSFGIDISLEELRRKYDTSLFSLMNIGFLSVNEQQEPAAYYGVFPIILQYNSADYSVAQSGDTMTAPDHRNKGLFVALAQTTYQFAETQGIQLIFGFPNQNSYPGFERKLQWVFTGRMQKFTLKNSMIPFCEAASKWKFLSPAYKSFARRRLSGYKMELTEENIRIFSQKTCNGFIKRDINYFKYKLSDPDNYLLSINGFSILAKPKVHLMIGLVGYFDFNRIDEFIQTIKKLGLKLACGKVVILASPNHWLTDYLNKKIKPEDSLPIGFYQAKETFDLKNIEFVLADYDTF